MSLNDIALARDTFSLVRTFCADRIMAPESLLAPNCIAIRICSLPIGSGVFCFAVVIVAAGSKLCP